MEARKLDRVINIRLLKDLNENFKELSETFKRTSKT